MRGRSPFSCALIHSPLVGPRSWEPVAAALQQRHVATVVPVLLGPDRYDALAAAAADPLGPGPWLVVVHSGGGALVPSLVERLESRCAAVVFVDALLPHPGRAWVDDAPAELVATLRELVGPDGSLPPWHTWFGPEAMSALIPDAALRAHVTADIPRVPLAYLETTAPPHRAWESVPCGYLRLSGAYAAEEASARRRGWSTARLDGHHLSAVTEPETVADAILVLAADLLDGTRPVPRPGLGPLLGP